MLEPYLCCMCKIALSDSWVAYRPVYKPMLCTYVISRFCEWCRIVGAVWTFISIVHMN